MELAAHLVLALGLLSMNFAAIWSTQFVPCENGTPPATSLDVENCDLLPCDFPNTNNNTHYTVALGFTLDREAQKVELWHDAWYLDTLVSFPLVNNTCLQVDPVNGVCPPAGTAMNVTGTLIYWRSFMITVEISARDEAQQGIACARFYARIGTAVPTTPPPAHK